MYGVIVEGWYLKLDGTTVNYACYPFETPEAAGRRAQGCVLSNWRWHVVDDQDHSVTDLDQQYAAIAKEVAGIKQL